MNDYSNDAEDMGAHGAIFARLKREKAPAAKFLIHGGQYIPSREDLPHPELAAYFNAVLGVPRITTAQRALALDAAEYCASEQDDITTDLQDLRQRFIWERSNELDEPYD